MNTNENSQIAAIEILENKRRATLLVFIYYFSSWQLGWIMTKYFSTAMNTYVYYFFGVLLILGTLGSLWHLNNLFKVSKLLKKHPELNPMINDERSCSLKNKSMAYGFTASIATSALFLAISTVADAFIYTETTLISANLVAHTTLVVTVLASVIAYAILEQQE
ncbi:MAG: hypothetical protein COB35_06305 [Gammaproteobacteria bacterium]|nr:MAG: hypothetical protein COB35_06305 [Gammaproteobacteria bacterium]